MYNVKPVKPGVLGFTGLYNKRTGTNKVDKLPDHNDSRTNRTKQSSKQAYSPPEMLIWHQNILKETYDVFFLMHLFIHDINVMINASPQNDERAKEGCYHLLIFWGISPK